MDERGYPCEYCGSHSLNPDDHAHCRQVASYEGRLREAAAGRSFAVLAVREAIVQMNTEVRAAYAIRMPVPAIAEAIGTTRQRVYEILREG